MNKKIKNIIFVLLLALLILPLFQHAAKFFNAGKLNGDFILAERPQFSRSTWIDGTFQAGFDRYIEDHIGFRNFFVRLNNQIEFTFFDEVNAEGIVKGKSNILYEHDYIRAFAGGDFIGGKTITRKMEKLKFLQNHLKEKFDIDLILILEPSKARIEPQFIPDHYLENGISISNYEYFKQKATDLKVDFIDLNKYLVEISDTIQYPVYPPYGIHWSEHTMGFITDTLIRYIEKKRNIDLPGFSVKNRIVGDSISDSDYDAGKTCNLLFRLPQNELPYPFFTFYDDSTKAKPAVLAVADSYYWNIFNTRVPQNLFTNTSFWYFNAKVYPDFYYGAKWTKDLDIKKEVEKQDVILLSITERFLYKFAWQFVEQLYEIYTPPFTGNIIEKKEDVIRNYSTWFDELVERANAENISLVGLIHKEASFLAEKENYEVYLSWYGAEYYKNMIQMSSSWDSAVRVKAIKNSQSYNDQLTGEANWIFKENMPDIYTKFTTIKNMENAIFSDSHWLKTVAEKAQKYNMPVEMMVSVDAEYVVENDPALVNFVNNVRLLEKTIKNNPDWLKKVGEKAQKKGISIDEMLRMDAKYIIKEQQKKQKHE